MDNRDFDVKHLHGSTFVRNSQYVPAKRKKVVWRKMSKLLSQDVQNNFVLLEIPISGDREKGTSAPEGW